MHLSSLKKIFKILGLLFLLVVALLASILAGRTASQYFAKASGCPATNVKAVQIGANNAVVTWETKDDTQGRVQYGTDPQNLSISAEASSGTTHNVPLTLLSPNTPYYFLIAICSSVCDSAGGQGCDKDHLENCTPWTFTTNAVKPQDEAIAPLETVVTNIPANITSKPTIATASPSAAVTPTLTSSAVPNTDLTPFCQQVQQNLGGNTSSLNWTAIKQYDMDENGIINGLDVIKCKTSGK